LRPEPARRAEPTPASSAEPVNQPTEDEDESDAVAPLQGR
jgi:hypothetical protein